MSERESRKFFFNNCDVAFILFQKEREIKEVTLVFNSDNFCSAEKEAIETVKKLNNLFFYYNNSFLVNEEKTTKNQL